MAPMCSDGGYLINDSRYSAILELALIWECPVDFSAHAHSIYVRIFSSALYGYRSGPGLCGAFAHAERRITRQEQSTGSLAR